MPLPPVLIMLPKRLYIYIVYIVETKANGLSQPFERLAQLVGSLVSISEVRGSSLALSTTKNLSHTVCLLVCVCVCMFFVSPFVVCVHSKTFTVRQRGDGPSFM